MRILQIFLKLEPILNEVADIENLLVTKYKDNEVLIAAKPAHDRYKHLQDKAEVNKEIHQLPVSEHNLDALQEEQYQIPTRNQNESSLPLGKSKSSSQDQKIEVKHITQAFLDAKKSSASSKPSSAKWNKNSSLSEDQRNWIHKDANKSMIKSGDKILWKCSICSANMSSSWILRKHLRDVHILSKDKSQRENSRGKPFMDEVRASGIIKILENGDEVTSWVCKRCDHVLKSESGFIKHLLYSHVKNALVDPSFIAKCKIQIEYEQERPAEIGWRCPECMKFYRTSVGLRNHLKLEHPDIDFGGERYHRKVHKSSERASVLKLEEKKCEILLATENGARSIWQCYRCAKPRYFRSESGFRAHIRQNHLQRRNIQEDKISKCKIYIDVNGVKQTIWTCPICPTSMKTKPGFISHVIQEHPGKFESVDDDFVVSSDEQYEKTQTKDDTILQKLADQVINEKGALKTEGYKFSCHGCGLFFKKHHPTHVGAHETLRQLVPCFRLPRCEQCNIIYCSQDDMLKHLNSHVDELPTIIACPSSGLALYGGKQYKEPTGTADDSIDENVWKCGHCFASYWKESDCVEHSLMLHMPCLTCPVDQLEFRGNRGLALFCLHMKNKHPELFSDLTYPCSYCMQTFHTVFDKLSHMKVCKEKKLQCDGCGRKFFNKVKLAHHMKIEKGILIYKCNICEKKCGSSMELRLHFVGAHTNDRLYRCTYKNCGKSFKTSATRSSHMETHSDCTLKCTFCESVFKKRVVLARHIKFMHNEVYRSECFNEFSCKLCNKSFLRRVNFKNHLKNVHSIIEEDQKE